MPWAEFEPNDPLHKATPVRVPEDGLVESIMDPINDAERAEFGHLGPFDGPTQQLMLRLSRRTVAYPIADSFGERPDEDCAEAMTTIEALLLTKADDARRIGELQCAGERLATVAFNLSQRAHLSVNERLSLDEARKDWDALNNGGGRGE